MIGELAHKLIEVCTIFSILCASVAVYLGAAVWLGKGMKAGGGE